MWLKKGRESEILAHCYSKTHLCHGDLREMLGISHSDKVEEIRVRRWGRKIGLIISPDDSSVGGYHNEGGEDQMWDNAFTIRIKKDMVKMTTDNSDNGRIMVAHFDSERFQLFYSSL